MTLTAVRWRGYGVEADDTWESRAHLMVGAERMVRDWERRRREYMMYCSKKAACGVPHVAVGTRPARLDQARRTLGKQTTPALLPQHDGRGGVGRLPHANMQNPLRVRVPAR